MQLDGTSDLERATNSLYEVIRPRFEKLGYNISRDIDFAKPETIRLSAQYTAWPSFIFPKGLSYFRFLLDDVVPDSYPFEGVTFPVNFGYDGQGEFLSSKSSSFLGESEKRIRTK